MIFFGNYTKIQYKSNKLSSIIYLFICIKDKKFTITKHVCVLKFYIIFDDLKSQNLGLCFIH